MIHVICIQWGTKYSDDYVNKLYASIKRNTSKGFLFTCFTDRSDQNNNIIDEVDIQPIPYFTGNWFSKIGLYNENLYHSRDQVFFFDLDTVITGGLDEIFSYKGKFICLRDFYRKEGLGSGFMSWRPRHAHELWSSFTRGYECRNGDQGWLEECKWLQPDIWQELYPEKIISYKVHIKDKGKIKNPNFTKYPGTLKTSSIVCFHGRPNPHEVKQDWIKEYWV